MGMATRERPLQPRDSYAGGNCWILIDVIVVIVVDEIVTERLSENEPGDCDQQNTEAADDPARWRRNQTWRGRAYNEKKRGSKRNEDGRELKFPLVDQAIVS